MSLGLSSVLMSSDVVDATMSQAAPERIGLPADAQVVVLAREAPAEALDLLYSAYRSRIYSFLLKLVGDPHLADDITQDSFTKAFRALGTLTPGSTVLSWLYRIANNAAIDHIRRRQRLRWIGLGGVTGTPDEPEGASLDDAGDRDRIRGALASLPAENAAALLLHALEGYSYKEIAEIQGCSMTAVRSRICRARQAFRKAYSETS